jgi:integrase
MKTKMLAALIEEFINDHIGAWATSTLQSEQARLLGLVEVLDGDPKRLWEELKRRNLGAYTIRTTWIRVTRFWQWALDREKLKGANHYRRFKEEKANWFKGTYQRKIPTLTYAEAVAKIQTLPTEALKNSAMDLLSGGLRYSEAKTLNEGHVVGKGGKTRRVFIQAPEGPRFEGSYNSFRRALALVGLKPHDLRKICASTLARQEGVTEQDLMKAMGWASMETAKSYLAPMRDEELAKRFAAFQGGINDGKEQVPKGVRGRS